MELNATSKREVSPSRTVVVTQSRSPSKTTAGWICNVLAPAGRTSKVSSKRGAVQLKLPASVASSPASRPASSPASAASSPGASRPESTGPESERPTSAGRSSSPQARVAKSALKRANRIVRPWPMRSPLTSAGVTRDQTATGSQRRRSQRRRSAATFSVAATWPRARRRPLPNGDELRFGSE